MQERNIKSSDLVRGLEIFLHSPPNYWPIISKKDNGISYRISEYTFNVEFEKKDSYSITVYNGNKDYESNERIKYLGGSIDFSDIFQKGISIAKRLANCK